MIIGVQTDRRNPEFTVDDFLFWEPQFTKVISTVDGQVRFKKIKDIADKKIFKSIFGSDWEYAMSLCVAHYFTLIAEKLEAPAGEKLSDVAGGGVYKGVVTGVTVGDFSKQFDLDKTTLSNKESKFWNKTSYGADLMALFASKPIPAIMTVITDPVRKK